MSVTSRVIIASKNAENSQTTQYTSSTGVRTLIDKFTATNYTAGAVTLSINLVSSGDTAGNQNLTVKTKSLAAGETYTFPEIVGHVLEPGDFISTLAGAATSINIRSTGRQIT
jgi:Mg/Co/Ni transporter MgtE